MAVMGSTAGIVDLLRDGNVVRRDRPGGRDQLRVPCVGNQRERHWAMVGTVGHGHTGWDRRAEIYGLTRRHITTLRFRLKHHPEGDQQQEIHGGAKRANRPSDTTNAAHWDGVRGAVDIPQRVPRTRCPGRAPVSVSLRRVITPFTMVAS